MTVPCSFCGSRNTVILPRGMALGRGKLLAKIAQGLSRLAQPFVRRPLMGQYMVVCRDCGKKSMVIFN